MNAVEIEEAVSPLAEAPFDAARFPFAFLEAFGNKETTIKRLQSGASNQSDVPGGVLQRNHIHIKVCAVGAVAATLTALRESPATTKQKCTFILATDGTDFEAENIEDGETVACAYADFHNHFGFFLPLAGITTVKQIRDNAFDIKATSRLNKLYLELLKTNPDWSKAARREELNHFMARLIFSFFAEDTGIFHPKGAFTQTVEQMSAHDATNTHEVLSEVFRAMNTTVEDRETAQIKSWAKPFPYVNGGLFSGSAEVPRFSRIARLFLLHVGNLDWTKINPDIFGSMIQAVADDDERSTLGMHYTSVPNTLKVLNPLFLDDLREKLAEAGDNPRKLLNLRERIARMRVFDPACGSGNFLVIAYKQLREIEAEINRRRNQDRRRSDIPLTNFRGIEIRHFSCEIARLALVIAEYQCDVVHLSWTLANAKFLPLEKTNWITCGNALRLDWLTVCPPPANAVNRSHVKPRQEYLFEAPPEQLEIEFTNASGETYICGNPPYLGSTWQSEEQKADLKKVFNGRAKLWKSLDYVAGWFMKAADYGIHTQADSAFVSTNSICQGQQVPILWPLVFQTGHLIHFAHTSFKWANLASHNAGVTVAIVGLSSNPRKNRRLYSLNETGEVVLRDSENINAYLVAAQNVIVEKAAKSRSELAAMDYGNKPTDDGGLILSPTEYSTLAAELPAQSRFLRRFIGSHDAIDGSLRFCIWICDEELGAATKNETIASRLKSVRKFRLASSKDATVASANWSHRFQEVRQTGSEVVVIIPRHSSENRDYLPFSLGSQGAIVADSAFAFYDTPWWNIAIFASRLHLVWIATVCGKLETRYRYSNTLGWNTFPVPPLTDLNKTDLTRCAEHILLAREVHFPATIADLYEPESMPANLRAAHDRNDETLERIYIGRRFKNDTERLEKLFALYTQMTAQQPAPTKPATRKQKPATHV